MTEIIERIAARGDGVTASGRFVVGAVPGDQVDANGVILPGPHHQQPLCRHYGRCGGCQLQHGNDSIYARFVVDRIQSALSAQGVSCAEMRVPHLSPAGTRRRASMRALREGKLIRLGFAEAGSNRIVNVTECPVLHPQLLDLVDPIRRLLGILLPGRKTATITMTLADQGVDLLMSGVEADGLVAAEGLTQFAQDHALARLSVDDGFGPQIRWEPQPVTVTLGGIPVALPEGAFLQATQDGEAALTAAMRAIVGDAGQVADLFAGLGTFSLALDVPVYAVEGARDAALALKIAANRSQKNVLVDHRDLFRRPITARELGRFDAVIIDPPRAGAKEQMEQIAASSVTRICSISCNPATFGRDAKTLVDGGYQLDWIQPVGQFRWSTHVELAACFTRI